MQYLKQTSNQSANANFDMRGIGFRLDALKDQLEDRYNLRKDKLGLYANKEEQRVPAR